MEDVNDPHADSRDHAYLTGYEWRLVPQNSTIADFSEPPIFSLGLLQFIPLTLERVVFDGENVSEVTIHGRLQLPLEEISEDDQSANTVRVISPPFRWRCSRRIKRRAMFNVDCIVSQRRCFSKPHAPACAKERYNACERSPSA